MNSDNFKKGFMDELERQTTSFNITTGMWSNETVLLGYEKEGKGIDQKSDFFNCIGIRGLCELLDIPNEDQTIGESKLMSPGDAITVQHSCLLRFLQCNQEEAGASIAKHVARIMFDSGIFCLFTALSNAKVILDHPIKSFEKSLFEHGDFSSSPYAWLIHSLPYFMVMKKYSRWATKPLFTFKGGGCTTDLITKRLIIRDKVFLRDDNRADEGFMVGLYTGAVAVFLDNLKIDLTENDVCKFSWDQNIAVKGFAGKNNNKQTYHSTIWEQTTKNKKGLAGFIVKTKDE